MESSIEHIDNKEDIIETLEELKKSDEKRKTENLNPEPIITIENPENNNEENSQ